MISKFHAVTAALGILVATCTSAACGEAAADDSATGVSNGATYTVTMSPLHGSTSDGNGQWHVKVGQLSGGDPAVVNAFNNASQASAHDLIDRARDGTEGLTSNFEADSHVTFRNIAVAESIAGMRVLGMMPLIFFNTIVIDSRTAQPITLANLFIDEQAGLNRLSEQTKLLLLDDGKALPDGPGNAPVEANFANWIPTAEGMEISFAPYQFESLGKFNPTIVVPWSALIDLLAPNMVPLAQG